MKWLRCLCLVSADGGVERDGAGPGLSDQADPPDHRHRRRRADGRCGAGRGRSLDKSLGQRLVIENRSGSGGNIGAEAVAKAEPDGYTLGLVQIGNVAINPYVYPDMTFDPFTDLVPVAPVTSSAILVVANAKVPANDLRELIALAKREPGKLSYGSSGQRHRAASRRRDVQGGGRRRHPARAVSRRRPRGERHGRRPCPAHLRGPGRGARRRSMPAFENPGGRATAAAQGRRRNIRRRPRPGCRATSSSTWFGIVAPKGTPAPVIAKLVQHIHAMQDDPEVQKRSGHRRAGGSEGNAGAVRRAHAPRSRALPRYRQGGEAEAGVKAVVP